MGCLWVHITPRLQPLVVKAALLDGSSAPQLQRLHVVVRPLAKPLCVRAYALPQPGQHVPHIVVEAQPIGRPLQVAVGMVCAVNKQAYLVVSPTENMWLYADDSILYQIQSNTNWNIEQVNLTT